MKKTVFLLMLLLATTAFAYPLSAGYAVHDAQSANNSTIAGKIITAKTGTLAPVAKMHNMRRPPVLAPSRFNPTRNVLHSTATAQTWDYQGYCLDQEKTVQLKASKLSCTYLRQDRQWNTWACANGGYLRCVGTGCPRNTCRVTGIRVS